MKTEFLDLKNLKYVLKGTPITCGEFVPQLEYCLSRFNKETGIIDDIIHWNKKFKNDSVSHPLMTSNSPVSREDFSEKWKDKITGRIHFHVEQMTASDLSQVEKLSRPHHTSGPDNSLSLIHI